MRAFHATRMDWVYTTNASFVGEAHGRGLELTLAMNPQTADALGENTHEVGRGPWSHSDACMRTHLAYFSRGSPHKIYEANSEYTNN